MQDEIQKMAEELGFKIQMDPDADLGKFRKGRPMLMSELEALPLGAIVHLYFYYDDKGYVRIDDCYRLTRKEEGTYFFEDGSSWSATFEPEVFRDGVWGPPGSDEPAMNTRYGPYQVYHAVPL